MRYCFLLFGFAVLAACEDIFVYPPRGNTFDNDSDFPKFELGSTIQLKWSSSLSTISIGLRRSRDPILLINGAAQGNILEKQPNENSTSWEVGGIGNIDQDPTYYLVGISEDESSYFTSNYFIIEQAAGSSSSSTTTSVSTTSSSSSTVPLSTSVSQTSVSQTSTSTPPPSDSGLSTGAKAGIGAGVPLGIAAIGLAAFLLYRRGVKKGQMAGADAGAGGTGAAFLPGTKAEWYTPKTNVPEVEGQDGRWVTSHEMPADGQWATTHEMPVDGQQRHQLPS